MPWRSRVLVIGCGFIGGRVTAALLEAGIPAKVLTRRPLSSSLAIKLAGAAIHVGDASDRDLVERILQDADHVVYAAGSVFPGADTLGGPNADAELRPLLTVLDAMGGSRKVLTFLSSGGTVYGVPEYLPVNESHPTNPINSYGVVKLTAERHVVSYSRNQGFGARVLRVSNAYGDGQRTDRGQGVIAAFLQSALTGREVPLYGDGSVVRDFIHVDDLAAAIVAIVRMKRAPEVINVGSGLGVSLLELINLVESVTQCRLNVTRLPARPVDIPRIVLDVTRLRALFPSRAMDLERGIALTWRATRR